MIDFSKKITVQQNTTRTNPVDIYDSLDRSTSAGPLRPIQNRVLTTWYNSKKDCKDLIIKLHTGAGKTLIGLLIAMSYLNNREGPAIYICPNIYLMKQACEEARKFGIPFCFIDKYNQIPDDFIQGKSILITYVQKVFNGLSVFGIGSRSTKVGCLILDDSHACMDSINSACTIKIVKDNPAFDELISLFEDDLRLQGEGTYQDFVNNSSSVLMSIPYWAWQSKISNVTKIISKQVDDLNVKFPWALLKDQLVDCQAIVSNSKIEIFPSCIPIQQFGIFNNAKHRILMSATTQEDTFFIKGLGLSPDAVSSPLVDDKYRWSGEKMLLIPDLICESTNSDRILERLFSIEHAYGIVALTPSCDLAQKYISCGAVLANDPSAKNMYSIMKEYKENFINKAIVLANRYDGIDLPDDTCRILILDSVPYYDSLSDRYEEICRSSSEIVRIKTAQKIEQGLGRSVRGEKDYSVILIIGSDLVKYLRSSSNCRLFSAQTQKQIEIGFEIADMAKEDFDPNSKPEIDMLMSTINQCLNRDEGWKAYYASMMDGITTTERSNDKLYDTLRKERDAYINSTVGDYEKACKIIQELIDASDTQEDKGWYLQQMACLKNRVSVSNALKLQEAAFRLNSQLLKPLTGITYKKMYYPKNETRLQRIINKLNQIGDVTELNLEVESMLSDLAFGTNHEKFEAAVKEVGELLGYLSQRPDKEIRKGPDNLWCVDANRYILIECKSEVQESRRSITKTEAGQMEEHCAWFEEEYGLSNVTNLMIIPSVILASDAYFSHDVKIINKHALNRFKNDFRDFIKEFKAYQLSTLTAEVVHSFLITHGFYDNDFILKYAENPKKHN